MVAVVVQRWGAAGEPLGAPVTLWLGAIGLPELTRAVAVLVDAGGLGDAMGLAVDLGALLRRYCRAVGGGAPPVAVGVGASDDPTWTLDVIGGALVVGGRGLPAGGVTPRLGAPGGDPLADLMRALHAV